MFDSIVEAFLKLILCINQRQRLPGFIESLSCLLQKCKEFGISLHCLDRQVMVPYFFHNNRVALCAVYKKHSKFVILIRSIKRRSLFFLF